MATVQDRLKLKRVPLDKWSIGEQLHLASAVACSGDQNWMSVSRSLKMMCGINRPSDWFSQKSCAAQYEKLLENVETPKRKKRSEKDTGQTAVELPNELILRKLTHERIAELKKLIQEERQEYNKIREEIVTIQNGSVDDNQLKDMWKQIELDEKRREEKQQLHDQWLKEREERKKELERAWRPNAFMYQQNSPNQSPSKSSHHNLKIKLEEMEVDDPNSRQGTSPLLTSLLKSPSPAPNPTASILNTMNIGGNQTRASAPTITNLLTGTINNIPTTMSAPSQKNVPGPSTATTSVTYPNQFQTQPLTGPPSHEHNANVVQSPSQSAPTLSMLLENKNREAAQKPLRYETQPIKIEATGNEMELGKSFGGDLIESDINATDSPIKDEEQQLMDVFNGLIPDDEDLADILNPEMLEEDAILDNVADLIDAEEVAQANADNKNFSDQSEAIDGNSANNFQNDLTQSDKPLENVEPEQQPQQQQIQQQQPQQQQPQQQQPLPQQQQQPQQAHPTEESKVLDGPQDKIKEEEQRREAEEDDDKPLAEIKKEEHSTTPLPETDSKLPPKDEDSSDSNDTPLSELIKQEANAKMEQAKESQATAAAAAAAVETVPTEREEPDTFESDSNDDKCLESIKREIQGLSELKENNSSENSSEIPEEKVEEKPTVDDEGNCSAATIAEEPTSTVDLPAEEKVEKIEEPAEPVAEDVTAKIEEIPVEPEPVEEPMVEQPEPKVEVEDDTMMAESKDSIESVEIVEIKDDDKSDDGKHESIIVIEETDSKDLALDSKEELCFGKLEDDDEDDCIAVETTIPDESSLPADERKMSSDEEVFEDAKENLEDAGKDEEATGDAECTQQTITIVDTDDDSPMEVIKEDKTGRMKRDYSRRKQESTPSTDKRSDDMTSGEEISSISTRMKLKDRDRSESPYCDEESGEPTPKTKRRCSSTPIMDSLPNSPASSDDREYRAWKKSILIVYSRLTGHKNASLFAKPISEEQVPDYKNIVLQPMDLQTLKRNIESGHIRSTIDFQRYVMIMCYNAIFYNFNDEVTCMRAKEMLSDALSLIDDLMDTWRKENEKSASSSSSSATKTIVRGRKSHRLMA